MLAGGECFGTGKIPLDIKGEEVKTGICPDCGRRIGLVHNSSRLTHHKENPTMKQRMRRLEPTRKFAKIAAKINASDWIRLERQAHADVKYAADTASYEQIVKELVENGLSGDNEVFLLNYLKRAQLFGLDTPQGRQALGKLTVTCIAYLEYAIEHIGPMPEPGVPSGEIREWIK